MNGEMQAAKILADKEYNLAKISLLKDLLKNPILEIVGGFVLVEVLQRYPKDRPIIGNIQGNLIEAGLTGIITVQQLAPSLPYLAESSGSILQSVGKLAPLLALAAPK